MNVSTDMCYIYDLFDMLTDFHEKNLTNRRLMSHMRVWTDVPLEMEHSQDSREDIVTKRLNKSFLHLGLSQFACSVATQYLQVDERR